MTMVIIYFLAGRCDDKCGACCGVSAVGFYSCSMCET